MPRLRSDCNLLNKRQTQRTLLGVPQDRYLREYLCKRR
jgi:hypothetical protein